MRVRVWVRVEASVVKVLGTRSLKPSQDTGMEACHGMVWYGMVRFGVVCYGTAHVCVAYLPYWHVLAAPIAIAFDTWHL